MQRLVNTTAVGALASLALLASAFSLAATAPAAARRVDTRARAKAAVVERDITYRVVEGEALKLDAYLPGGAGPHPAVILIYGGGWIVGSKALWRDYAPTLAAAGFATFAVNYRLAPKDPYPAAVKDVRASVEWLRDNASRFGVDPDRVAALGGSAGGHLSALLATLGDGRRDRGARVATAVSWAGPMDLHPRAYPSESHPYVDAFLDCQARACDADRVADASPIEHVDPSDGTMLLIHGAEDQLVPLEQVERMAGKLDRAGVTHRLIVVPNAGHDSRLAPALRQPSLEWLRVQLRPEAKPLFRERSQGRARAQR